MTRTGNNGKLRWMIVDDNPHFLDFMERAVSLYTDRVIECFSGPQSALAAFKLDPEAYEFVITDFEMPDMNGTELCRQLQERSPSLKVLLVTGSQELKNEEFREKGFCGRLQKPFGPAEFARILSCLGIGKVGITLATIMGS